MANEKVLREVHFPRRRRRVYENYLIMPKRTAAVKELKESQIKPKAFDRLSILFANELEEFCEVWLGGTGDESDYFFYFIGQTIFPGLKGILAGLRLSCCKTIGVPSRA